MPTKIQMDRLVEGKWHPISVSPAEFAVVRRNQEYRIRNNAPLEAFLEFKDIGPRGENSFIEDCSFAIANKNYGPSWITFLECLKKGSIFSIITARGHEYETLKNGVKYVIDNCLTSDEKNQMYNNCLEYASIFDKGVEYKRVKGNFTDNELIIRYLDCCKFYGVGQPYSNSIKKEFKLSDETQQNLEQDKQIVLNKFIEICNNYGKESKLGVSVGFSDDDKRNVEHIKSYFERKSSDHINLKLNVFDTSTKEGIRTKYINGIITEYMGAEMGNKEASIMRFNQFNSQPNTLQNSTNDFTGHNMQQQAKTGVDLYKKTFKKKPKKFLKKKVKKAT
jgi:hypothetical protein